MTPCKLTTRLGLRGDLTVKYRNVISGREMTVRARNQITYNGLNALIYLLSQDSITATDYRLLTLVPGTSGTPPSRGDLAVGSPISSGDWITLGPSNRTKSPETNELIITATLGTGAGNGFTLREVGLLLGNTQLFARQVTPAFPKTSDFTVGYSWRFAFEAL